MKFLTGAEEIPALGAPPKITVQFKHDCSASADGTQCKCYPTVSTCAYLVNLPIHISSEEEIIQVFDEAIQLDVGFNRC